jgi:hypothetical protein
LIGAFVGWPFVAGVIHLLLKSLLSPLVAERLSVLIFASGFVVCLYGSFGVWAVGKGWSVWVGIGLGILGLPGWIWLAYLPNWNDDW